MTLQYDPLNIQPLNYNYKYIQFFADALPLDTTAADPPNSIAPMSALNVWFTYIDNRLMLVSQTPFTVISAGTIQSFRIYNPNPQCTIQGTVSLPGDGGDLILDAVDVTVGQVITMTEVTVTVNIS